VARTRRLQLRRSPGDWQTFVEVFDASLEDLKTLDAQSSKPSVMIDETAVFRGGRQQGQLDSRGDDSTTCRWTTPGPGVRLF
jgi:hypothetical protein